MPRRGRRHIINGRYEDDEQTARLHQCRQLERELRTEWREQEDEHRRDLVEDATDDRRL
jgi:hypothetical protein